MARRVGLGTLRGNAFGSTRNASRSATDGIAVLDNEGALVALAHVGFGRKIAFEPGMCFNSGNSVDIAGRARCSLRRGAGLSPGAPGVQNQCLCFWWLVFSQHQGNAALHFSVCVAVCAKRFLGVFDWVRVGFTLRTVRCAALGTPDPGFRW